MSDLILAFLNSHGLATIIPLVVMIFSVLSLALTFLASLFVIIGKKAPGWIGTASGWVGQVLHFLNGNVAAAKSLPPKS